MSFYRLKKRNLVVISTDKEKAFDKIHYPFMIKLSQQVGYRRALPKPDKAPLQNKAKQNKTTTNIILNSERPNEIKARMPTLPIPTQQCT